MSVVDYGDVEVAPPALQRSHNALERRLREILAAGAVPLVLGGDHSLSLPTMRVLAERHGRTERRPPSRRPRRHPRPASTASAEGVLRASQIVRVGLRGTWPEPEDFDWMRGEGFRWHTMDEDLAEGPDRGDG